MGIFLNPGNAGFTSVRKAEYVDKSGLIQLVNQAIGTPERLICVSRPRRFGKSYAAKMLCAYYDRSCDSSALFDDLAIAGDDGYRQHLNHYNVIYLDMTAFLGTISADRLIVEITESITAELQAAFPGMHSEDALYKSLSSAVEQAGAPFIMIIDEWDAPIRESREIELSYLRFLRSLFKNSGVTDKIFAAAYMTGILPIKKDGSQSAISDFLEYTVLKPRKFAEYVGFSEAEVRRLCTRYDCDFERMKQWYDGYFLRDIGSVYNPNSVISAIRNRDFSSYWTETSAASSLLSFISMDYEGLGKTITELIGGIRIHVETEQFANDLTTFRGRDDVLTLLIHLGYLAYDEENGTAWIPNEEIRLEFAKAIRHVNKNETFRRIQS